MITNKEVFIKKTSALTSEYVENELKKQGFNVLKWAIVKVKKDCYKLNVAIIE